MSVRMDTRRPAPPPTPSPWLTWPNTGPPLPLVPHHSSHWNHHNSGDRHTGRRPELVTATPQSYRWPAAPGWHRCGNYFGTLKRRDNKNVVTRYLTSVGKRSRSENRLRVSPYGIVQSFVNISVETHIEHAHTIKCIQVRVCVSEKKQKQTAECQQRSGVEDDDR